MTNSGAYRQARSIIDSQKSMQNPSLLEFGPLLAGKPFANVKNDLQVFHRDWTFLRSQNVRRLDQILDFSAFNSLPASSSISESVTAWFPGPRRVKEFCQTFRRAEISRFGYRKMRSILDWKASSISSTRFVVRNIRP
jgi:hypothetical protein